MARASRTSADPVAHLAGYDAVLEDYGEPRPYSPADVATLAADRLPAPPEWKVDGAYATDLFVVFETQGSSSKVTIPVLYGSLSRGSATLEVEVVDVRQPLARAWADYVLVGEAPEPIPLGTGFAAGNACVIDRGHQLIRATYWDGPASSLPPAAVQQRVRELLGTFGTSSISG